MKARSGFRSEGERGLKFGMFYAVTTLIVGMTAIALKPEISLLVGFAATITFGFCVVITEAIRPNSRWNLLQMVIIATFIIWTCGEIEVVVV